MNNGTIDIIAATITINAGNPFFKKLPILPLADVIVAAILTPTQPKTYKINPNAFNNVDNPSSKAFSDINNPTTIQKTDTKDRLTRIPFVSIENTIVSRKKNLFSLSYFYFMLSFFWHHGFVERNWSRDIDDKCIRG